MLDASCPRIRTALASAAVLALLSCLDTQVQAAPAYNPISPTMANMTVTLTGEDLTLDQLIQVARYGAKVQVSPEAVQREADHYGLLLEAAAEGIPVYWFNRGAGDQRETVIFSGDPLSAENKPKIERSLLTEFRMSALGGMGPEVTEEEIVRAMMVVRANGMTYNAPSPQLAQMLIDLINKRITPVVQSRGSLGEADLSPLGNIGGTMVGAGDAYYQGVRMPAAEALAKAGLKPMQPFAADNNALTSSNSYSTAIAALATHDARRALEWADLIYAMDLNGMNSSITPLSLVVQRERPEKWLNWDAARVMGMIKGSYLFGDDPKRIIQDPESLRASSIRQASAWEAWADLKDSIIFQMNSSDHNPAVRTDLSPTDSWELSTPQMMKYYVKGGPNSKGKHGYIVSNANWDPYPMANKMEAFVIALANMDVAVMLRIDRFSSTFFTGVKASDVVPHDQTGGFFAGVGGYDPVDLQQEIQSLTNPVAPFGAAIVGTVEDLQAQTRIKAYRVSQAVSTTFDLLGHDLLAGAFWVDIRKAQDASREFGPGTTAAWTAFRKVVPFKPDLSVMPKQSNTAAATSFIKATEPSTFYPYVEATDQPRK
ncbi:MAG: aromatic amino acid lyase [Rhodospirillales bacterium]|nr:aromatic amino acid lyase [Rhodospirillales bacterium]